MKSTVIPDIVRQGLCIGCGTCAALCPKKILRMSWNDYGEYEPIEINPCSKACGTCLQVCPFAESDNNEDTIGKELYGSIPGIMHRPETGYYQSAYVGYADEKNRSRGASGGMVTWLLEKLLTENIVDYAICVTPNGSPEKLFTFTVFNAPEEVRKGAGSAYYPVEMSEALEFILKTPGKCAIVGLPCFIKAIRLAQIKNKTLRERITVTVGLVCGQMKSKNFTGYIAALAGVRGKLTGVRYRGKSSDQPASNFYFSFFSDEGDEKSIYWNNGIAEAWLNRWFTPEACNYCDDIFAECADIVCMDAWLPEYSQDSKGTSILLVRSSAIALLMSNNIGSSSIVLHPIAIDKVLRSQRSVIEIKRRHLSYRLYRHRKDRSKSIKKRVTPANLNNPFHAQEIILQEQMQLLSRDLWRREGLDSERFAGQMRPYIRRIRNNNKLFNAIAIPVIAIKKRLGRGHDGRK